MGITDYTLLNLQKLLESNKIESVCDLGAQNLYTNFAANARERQNLSGWPYASEFWAGRGVKYMCIDLNGENDAQKWDLSEPLKTSLKFDFVIDAGTSEHVADLYECLANVNKLTKVGGLMYHENPKTGNWPKHGWHFRTKEFYQALAEAAGYEIVLLEEHPAMGNTTDGWNIVCAMRKAKEEFIEKDQFPKAEKE